MKLLLINKNPVVSRMMLMSVPKAGFEIEECSNVYELPSGQFEVVVIDDEMYDENFLHDIKQNIQYQKLGLITASKTIDEGEFDFVLHKPFLPTDLMEILREIKTSLTSMPPKEEQKLPQEPLKKFLAADEESEEEVFLKDFNSTSSLEDESIVEIEENAEESPFVKGELEKSGVLDEKEIQKVSQLLKESEEEPSEKPLSSLEDIIPVKEESSESLLSSFDEEKLQKIEKSEDSSVDVVSPLKEHKDEFMQSKSEESIETPQPQLQSASIQQELSQMSVDKLRQLLDGMQLVITIKITFPDKR